MRAKKFLLKNHFVGLPKLDDFELVEEELPNLNQGEILCEAQFQSVDPGSRVYTNSWPLGITMKGRQIAKVIESQNEQFPVGTLVQGYWGWRSHTIVDPARAPPDPHGMFDQLEPLPDFGGLPASYAIGVLGVPGLTAYFGLLELCQPKAGDVVLVSGAAGAVGSIAGQIAKIKGCRVIGFAGTEDKVRWLQEELGFDRAFNYKTVDWHQSIKEAAPNGIDCYFDNVGGEFSSAVRDHMARFGRIAVSGSTSTYNNENASTMIPSFETTLILKQIRIEGFVVNRFQDGFKEAQNQMIQWIKEGKVKVKETITEGFENIPMAYVGMLQGENTGKAIIKM